MRVHTYSKLKEYLCLMLYQDERVISRSLRVPRHKNGFHDENEVADRTDFHFDGDDEMIDDNDVADQMKIEAICASGSCKSMPSKQKMEIKV